MIHSTSSLLTRLDYCYGFWCMSQRCCYVFFGFFAWIFSSRYQVGSCSIVLVSAARILNYQRKREAFKIKKLSASASFVFIFALKELMTYKFLKGLMKNYSILSNNCSIGNPKFGLFTLLHGQNSSSPCNAISAMLDSKDRAFVLIHVLYSMQITLLLF